MYVLNSDNRKWCAKISHIRKIKLKSHSRSKENFLFLQYCFMTPTITFTQLHQSWSFLITWIMSEVLGVQNNAVFNMPNGLPRNYFANLKTLFSSLGYTHTRARVHARVYTQSLRLNRCDSFRKLLKCGKFISDALWKLLLRE